MEVFSTISRLYDKKSLIEAAPIAAGKNIQYIIIITFSFTY